MFFIPFLRRHLLHGTMILVTVAGLAWALGQNVRSPGFLRAQVTTHADLRVQLSGPQNFNSSLLYYQVRVTNQGSESVDQPTIMISLPPGFTLPVGTGTDCPRDAGGALACHASNIPTLGAHSTTSYSLSLQPPSSYHCGASGMIYAVVTQPSGNVDSDVNNDYAVMNVGDLPCSASSSSAGVSSSAAMVPLGLSFSTPVYSGGGLTISTIATVTNPNAVSVSYVRVGFIPYSADLVPGSSDPSCGQAPGGMYCPLSGSTNVTIPPGGSKTFGITVRSWRCNAAYTAIGNVSANYVGSSTSRNIPINQPCTASSAASAGISSANASSSPAASSIGVNASSAASSIGVNASSAASSLASSQASSAASFQVSVPRVCANGDIEPGEQCEIGYPCPAGTTCSASCTCITVQSSASSLFSSVQSTSHASSATSSAWSAASSLSTQSSFASTAVGCGDGILQSSLGEQCDIGISCPSGQSCYGCRCTTATGYCGDGTVSVIRGEECEANDDCPSGEVCSTTCTCQPGAGGQCGNGQLEGLEQCDIGHPCTAGMTCSNCICAQGVRCGNGTLERGEHCEQDAQCPMGLQCVSCLCRQRAQCGNGVLDPGEQCEQDSHCLTGQICNRSTCQCRGQTGGICGDGVLNSTEQCDLGQPCGDAADSCNLLNCLCSSNPMGGTCGNAEIDAGEDCDITYPCSAGKVCNFANCHCEQWESRCADAMLDIGEQCEVGQACPLPNLCDLRSCQCALSAGDAVCGNGQMDIGEECEVGSPCPFGWSCDYPRCMCHNQPVCGDDTVDPGEECEVSLPCPGENQMCDFSRCRCTGQVFVCGNGARDPGEECDDGNIASGDGCSAICQREMMSVVGSQAVCGDGIVEPPEECDDGNAVSGDGCSDRCIPDVALGSAFVATPRGQIIAGERETPQILRGAAGLAAQAASRGPVTITFPSQPQAAAVTGEPTAWQPAYYGSVIPYAPPSAGPVGKTGPASVAVMAAGAAAGFAWMRRRRRD